MRDTEIALPLVLIGVKGALWNRDGALDMRNCS